MTDNAKHIAVLECMTKWTDPTEGAVFTAALTAAIAALKGQDAEIARLREALEQASDYDYCGGAEYLSALNHVQRITRAALEAK